MMDQTGLIDCELTADERALVAAWLDLVDEAGFDGLMRLRPRYRTILILHYLMRKSFEDIAADAVCRTTASDNFVIRPSRIPCML